LPHRHRGLLVFIELKRRCKKNGEKRLGFEAFTVLLLTIFSIDCYFWGDRVIRDISAHRHIFAPPPPSLARVYQNKAASQKER